MTKRFTVLHVIVWAFRVLGVLAVIVGLVAGIVGLVGGFGRGFGMMDRYNYGRMMGAGIGFGYFFGSLLGGILLYGAGEVIDLLLAIETNTRAHTHVVDDKKSAVVQASPEAPANPE
jgi:Na+/glutamate symporter